MGQAVVVLPTRLVGEMLQAVPLRAGLRVDGDFVVHGTKFGEVAEINFLLMQLLAVEARELNIVQRPVELDALAGADLARSS